MTDIIEQMYKEYGVEPKYIDACTIEDKYWNNEELANEYITFDNYMNAKCGNQENCTTECSCAYTKVEYPKFTAEKQIELIKLIGKEIGYGRLAYKLESLILFEHSNFIDALAQVTINFKENLDNSKIKEILEK